MISRNFRLAVTASMLAISGAAYAQAVPVPFLGTSGGEPTTSTTLGTATTTTTGDSSVSPFQNTTTTVQQQTVNTSTPSTTTATTPVVVNGITYNGTKTVSGTGSQNQTATASRTDTFTPGLPPVLASSTTTPTVVANVGNATVTAVSASGFIGSAALADNYQATLSTSGPVTNGSVAATSNSTTVSQTGTTYITRIGTATYDPSTGLVNVVLPSNPSAQTSITSGGVTTTGTVAAATFTGTTGNITTINATQVNASGINVNNGRITNLGPGVAGTDAANVNQVNAVQTNLTNAVATLNGTITTTFNTAIRRADAGTAVALALGGGYFLPGKKLSITANFGSYRGESAVAGSIAYLVSDNVALNAGVATSLSGGSFGGTGFRAGATFGF